MVKNTRVHLRSGQAIVLETVSGFFGSFRTPTSCSLCFSVSCPNNWSLWCVSHTRVIINLTAVQKALISRILHGCRKPGNLAQLENSVWKDYGTAHSKNWNKCCATGQKNYQPRAVSMHCSSRYFKSMCGSLQTYTLPFIKGNSSSLYTQLCLPGLRNVSLKVFVCTCLYVMSWFKPVFAG